LFGARWLPSVPAMRVLCLGAVLWPLHVINLNVLMAQGHSNLFFRLEVVKKVVGIALLAIGCFYGVMGIAWSQTAFGVLGLFINAYFTKTYLGYGTLDQTRDVAPIVAVALPMAALAYWVSVHLQLTPVLVLACSSLAGALFFVSVSWVCRLAALHDTVDLLRRNRPAASLG
jgi:O-antigen/teichoic acid export membrane protein